MPVKHRVHTTAGEVIHEGFHPLAVSRVPHVTVISGFMLDVPV
jgi:hypothetical protein